MVTAELAACLPVLVLILAVAVSAVLVAGARVRVQDAAHEAARACARADPATASRLAEQAAPGVALSVDRAGETVTAVATLRVHLLSGWLPAVTVSERAVAMTESTAGPP